KSGGDWLAPASIRQGPKKVGFYLYRTLAYDLEGLTPGAGQLEKRKAFARVARSIRQMTF
ncbi:hypothetical protein CN925_19010, partial [Bacillus sp. AFS055030]